MYGRATEMTDPPTVLPKVISLKCFAYDVRAEMQTIVSLSALKCYHKFVIDLYPLYVMMTSGGKQ